MLNLPPYAIFPTISDDRVLLRQIHLEEVKYIIEITYYDAIQASTEQEAIEMQKKINKDYMDGNSIHWGIVQKSTNTIIGTCSFCRGFNNSSGELGCVLLPKYRGQGYMTSALKLAIEFGESNIMLNRIWAATSKQNIKAINLLKSLNFVKSKELLGDELEFEYKK